MADVADIEVKKVHKFFSVTRENTRDFRAYIVYTFALLYDPR